VAEVDDAVLETAKILRGVTSCGVAGRRPNPRDLGFRFDEDSRDAISGPDRRRFGVATGGGAGGPPTENSRLQF